MYMYIHVHTAHVQCHVHVYLSAPSLPPSLPLFLSKLTSRAYVGWSVESHPWIGRPGSDGLHPTWCQSQTVHTRSEKWAGSKVRMIATLLHTLPVTCTHTHTHTHDTVSGVIHQKGTSEVGFRFSLIIR